MRQNILSAARDLFYEKGLDGTSMRDIAAAVGLVPSSLYNHFPTKDSLVKAVMERNFETINEKVQPFFDGPRNPELLRTVLEAHAFHHMRHPKETFLFHLQRRHLPDSVRECIVELRHIYEDRFYTLVEELAEMGYVTSNEPRARMRFLLSSGAAVSTWYQPAGRFSAEEVAKIYADLALAALEAPGSDPAACNALLLGATTSTP